MKDKEYVKKIGIELLSVRAFLFSVNTAVTNYVHAEPAKDLKSISSDNKLPVETSTMKSNVEIQTETASHHT